MYKFCFIVLALTMATFVKAQFKISKQVFSNAATQQSSANILLNGSVGQAIAIVLPSWLAEQRFESHSWQRLPFSHSTLQQESN